jgi:hypothetical protein
MLAWRKSAATALMNNFDDPSIVDVLNFLYSIGMLLRTGVIDNESAFHYFGRRALAYWHFAEPYVSKRRLVIPNVWNDFDLVLVAKMKDYMNTKDYPSNPEIWLNILRNETKLGG